MRKITESEAHAKMSCLSCEANATCQWVKGIAKSDRKQWICINYANARLGYHWNGARRKRVEE